jgi:catalase
LSVGDHGPLLLQDYQLIEKLAHFTASASRSGSCTPRGRAPTATSNSAAT